MPAKTSQERDTWNWYILSRFRDELFGIAIISIMAFHYFEDVAHAKPGGILGETAFFYNAVFGSIGVEMFLFLSGMGLCFSMKKDPHAGDFYRKRLKRLLLPYAVCGLIFWSLRDLVILKKGFETFLMDFSLLSFWMDGIKTLWYIALLVPLYLLYPLLYACFSGKKPVRLICFAVFLAAGIALPFWLKAEYPKVFKHTEIALFRVPVFLCGAYMGERIYAHEKIHLLDLLFLLAGFVCRLWNVLAAYHVLSVPCPIEGRLVAGMFGITLSVVLAFLVQTGCSGKLQRRLRIVGSCSLELFLTHVCIRNLMNLTKYPTRELFNYCFCIAFSVFGTWLLKRFTKYVWAKDLKKKPDQKKAL